ncbi:hypothetical protein E2542_SST08156 [Spatholobus suberectus]|nr:hypothetical protein E2542_SST08156 [Spatholobus suberectus]
MNTQTCVNQMNNTENKFFQDNDEAYDDKILYTKMALDWDGKMTSQLQDKSTGGNLNATVGKGTQGEKEEKEEAFSTQDKRKESVQRVSSFVIAAIVLLWITFDISTHASVIQLQPEHGPVFIWSSLLEAFGFMVFVLAVASTIVIGAPFSRLRSAMLMFWAILMLVRSAKSIA